jgi:hypothetical protein
VTTQNGFICFQKIKNIGVECFETGDEGVYDDFDGTFFCDGSCC